VDAHRRHAGQHVAAVDENSTLADGPIRMFELEIQASGHAGVSASIARSRVSPRDATALLSVSRRSAVAR